MKRKDIVNYRSIYETHFGEIPKDKDGRSYEVHHIDGNYRNNSPKNLLAVSISEHYDIHFEQGDFCAARLIAMRMKKTKEEISELARLGTLKQIAEGRNWLTSQECKDFIRERNIELARLGNHPWQRDEYRQKTSKRMLELAKTGSHPFQCDNVRQKSSERASKRNEKWLEDGTHPFQSNHMRKLASKNATERNKRLASEGKMFSQTEEGKKIISKSMSKTMKGMVSVFDRAGNGMSIPKEDYYLCKNSGLPVIEWEYAQNRSKEGQRRKLLKM